MSDDNESGVAQSPCNAGFPRPDAQLLSDDVEAASLSRPQRTCSARGQRSRATSTLSRSRCRSRRRCGRAWELMQRCAPLVASGGGLADRLRRGARLQINASSLTGAHGPGPRAAGFDLVARGWVSAVASDAHGRHRPPLLGAAVGALAARGLDAVPFIVDGPRALLREGVARAPSPVGGLKAPGPGADWQCRLGGCGFP
jgi:hypothetical protein